MEEGGSMGKETRVCVFIEERKEKQIGSTTFMLYTSSDTTVESC